MNVASLPFDPSPANSFGRRALPEQVPAAMPVPPTPFGRRCTPEEMLERAIKQCWSLATYSGGATPQELRRLGYLIGRAADQMQARPEFRRLPSARERQGGFRRALRRALAWWF